MPGCVRVELRTELELKSKACSRVCEGEKSVPFSPCVESVEMVCETYGRPSISHSPFPNERTRLCLCVRAWAWANTRMQARHTRMSVPLSLHMPVHVNLHLRICIHIHLSVRMYAMRAHTRPTELEHELVNMRDDNELCAQAKKSMMDQFNVLLTAKEEVCVCVCVYGVCGRFRLSCVGGRVGDVRSRTDTDTNT